jgi:predicted O-methyltransferase YrrM
MQYDLSHLTQNPAQMAAGPIQDDEALLLFAVCRVICARRVAEFGGLDGYSAANFLAALKNVPNSKVYTVDPAFNGSLLPNQVHIRKWAKDVVAADFDNEPLDLVFFDCHDYGEQLQAYETLTHAGIISRATILALHDTGTHPQKFFPWAFAGQDGYIHQTAERELVNQFQDLGYECISFHAPTPLPPLRYRHGLTLCRFKHRFDNSGK